MNEFRNMLYAIDLDAENIVSVVYALEFAERFKSRLHIVYINDPQAGYRHTADREDAVALKVKDVAPQSLLEKLEIIYATSRGDTAEEIVRYAEEHHIDLILVGHRHRGKVYSSMFDSIDVNIIDTAHLPVLVIPKT